MRALGYHRVSTAEQASNGHSLALAPERLRAWCVARGLDLVDVIADEGVSASKPLAKRKGGADLLARMAAGHADVVVVIAIDRLFRDAQDGLNTLQGADGKGGLPVQSVTEPIDTTTAMGRFILTVWLARAQLEREHTCERNLAISRGLRRAGRTNGITPYGCVERNGHLFRDPITWPHREHIVELRTTPMSYDAIAERLAQAGIRAPQGGERWGKKSVQVVVRTHDGLKHIPPLPADHETAVSEAAPA
jgi:site-specific DNA recombinase